MFLPHVQKKTKQNYKVGGKAAERAGKYAKWLIKKGTVF